jgi:MerR family Zn(II)-responsive transcriptional regulator of zntA
MDLPLQGKVKEPTRKGAIVRIGELAAMTGTTTKALRLYEERGLLPPPQRTPGGYRDYPPEAGHRLDFIRRGRNAGLTLAQIAEILGRQRRRQAPCHHVEQLLASRLAELDKQIADLHELCASVAELHSLAIRADPESCDAATICRYL